MLRHASSGENVKDLSHGNGGKSRLLDGVEHGLRRRLQGEVVAVGGAAVVPGGAHKGSGNDAPHAVLALELLPGDAAVPVELLQRHHFLVGGNLEDGIGGGIDDQISGAHVLVAVEFNSLGAGDGLIAEDSPPGGCPEGRQDLLGKAVGIGGHGLGGDHTGDFPVADGGVLAHGCLGETPIGARGGSGLGKAGNAVDQAQTRGNHRWDLEL